jgi:hypothetical protein
VQRITIIWKRSPLPPPSLSEWKISTNTDRNGGDTPIRVGDITSITDKIPSPKQLETDAYYEEGGDGGGSGDLFHYIGVELVLVAFS